MRTPLPASAVLTVLSLPPWIYAEGAMIARWRRRGRNSCCVFTRTAALSQRIARPCIARKHHAEARRRGVENWFGYASEQVGSTVVANDGEHEAFVLGGDLDSISASEAEFLQPRSGHANVRDELPAAAIVTVSAIHRRDDKLTLSASATSPGGRR